MAEYNGWPNDETWCVNLWLTNDERMYRASRIAAGTGGADAVRNYVESLSDVERATDGSGLVADLVNHALVQVDRREVTEALLAE